MTTLDIVGLIMAALLIGLLALIYILGRRDTSTLFEKEEEVKKENPYVKCGDCACILDKESAEKVKFNIGGPSYFCHEHKPPYDEVVIPYGFIADNRYFRTETIEVTREGKPVKK